MSFQPTAYCLRPTCQRLPLGTAWRELQCDRRGHPSPAECEIIDMAISANGICAFWIVRLKVSLYRVKTSALEKRIRLRCRASAISL